MKDTGSNSFSTFSNTHIRCMQSYKMDYLVTAESRHPEQYRSVKMSTNYSQVIYLAADKGEQKRFSVMDITEPYLKLVK